MRRYASVFYTTESILKISTQLTQNEKMKEGNTRNCDKIKENRQLEISIEAYKFG